MFKSTKLDQETKRLPVLLTLKFRLIQYHQQLKNNLRTLKRNFLKKILKFLSIKRSRMNLSPSVMTSRTISQSTDYWRGILIQLLNKASLMRLMRLLIGSMSMKLLQMMYISKSLIISRKLVFQSRKDIDSYQKYPSIWHNLIILLRKWRTE